MFKLYAICIMSNHVHYLIELNQPDDIPKIMHFLNWYTATCFNRMLNRTGHFWERRYYCDGFRAAERERVLNTLRYIHGNPKAAKMRSGSFYEFSNYGSYDQLTRDGLTQWHPAFLKLSNTLEECARKYQGFCQRYKPKPKPARKCQWGNKLLAGLDLKGDRRNGKSQTLTASPASSSPRLPLPLTVPDNEKPDGISNCGAIHLGEPGSWTGEDGVLRGNCLWGEAETYSASSPS